jgi:hypothetical protein
LPVPGDDKLGTIKKLSSSQEGPGKIGTIEHRFKQVRAIQVGPRRIIRTPDGISIELLQAGEALVPAEPWTSMANTAESQVASDSPLEESGFEPLVPLQT